MTNHTNSNKYNVKFPLIIAHIRDVICSGDIRLAHNYLSYLSDKVNDRDNNTVVILSGKQGAGKSVFVDRVLSQILPEEVETMTPATTNKKVVVINVSDVRAAHNTENTAYFVSLIQEISNKEAISAFRDYLISYRNSEF